MYPFKLSLAFVLVLIFTATTALADLPVSWGDVSQEEWDMTSFPNDDEASSIILVDFGESYFDNELNTVFRHHRRVKILDPDNSDYTEVSIRVYREDRSQYIRQLRAQTIYIDKNGIEQRERVGRREFNATRDGDWEITTFAFPDVRPGSIVEYSYTLTYRRTLAIRSWDFQHDEPVVHSEYRVLIPNILTYMVFRDGFEAFEINEETQTSGGVGMAGNTFNAPWSIYYRMVLKDAPAIRKEPFITTKRNYVNRVTFQLSAYTDGRGMRTDMLRTWNDVAELYTNMQHFGRQLRSNRSIRNKVRDITEGLTEQEEIAKTLYDYVAENVVWNQRFRARTEDSISNALDNNSGNSAEKALLLINMLNQANLEAYPVLIATRSFGKIQPAYPNVTQFNHVLVMLHLGDSVLLLDPVVPIIPFGLMHPNSLNYYGLVIKDDHATQITIDQQVASASQAIGIVSLDEYGNLEGQFRVRYSGYEGIIHRNLINDSEENVYLVNALFGGDSDVEILESSIENLDNPSEFLQTTLTFKRHNHAVAAGDMMYINPFLLNRISSNPFQNPVRNFPIEFPYGVDNEYTVTLTMPDGYEIDYIPEQKVVELSDNTAYVMQIMPSGPNVQISTRMIRADIYLESEKYADLRSFYDDIVSMNEEQIIIKRIDEQMGETGDQGE